MPKNLELCVLLSRHATSYLGDSELQTLANTSDSSSGGFTLMNSVSRGGAKAVRNYGPVVAAKAALEWYIRQLVLELASAGITANAILAGVTEHTCAAADSGHENLMEIAKKRNPHKRLTPPDEVARCIVVLCHRAPYWMTVNPLRVDGGESIVG